MGQLSHPQPGQHEFYFKTLGDNFWFEVTYALNKCATLCPVIMVLWSAWLNNKPMQGGQFSYGEFQKHSQGWTCMAADLNSN